MNIDTELRRGLGSGGDWRARLYSGKPLSRDLQWQVVGGGRGGTIAKIMVDAPRDRVRPATLRMRCNAPRRSTGPKLRSFLNNSYTGFTFVFSLIFLHNLTLSMESSGIFYITRRTKPKNDLNAFEVAKSILLNNKRFVMNTI